MVSGVSPMSTTWFSDIVEGPLPNEVEHGGSLVSASTLNPKP